MNVFISHSSKDANIAKELAQALSHHAIHPVLDFVPGTGSAALQEALKQGEEDADGFVFVLGTGEGSDRKLELERRYALRKQWDSEGSKPMIPILLGNADAPPFLRDRKALRVSTPNVNYDELAGRIAHLIEHPDDTVDWKRREEASEQLKERLGEIDRFAESLEATQESVDSQAKE